MACGLSYGLDFFLDFASNLRLFYNCYHKNYRICSALAMLIQDKETIAQ